MKTPLRLVAALAAAGLPAGCGQSETTAPAATTAAPAFDESRLAVPADPILAVGQRVYRGDCYNCHDAGKKGAPRIADRTAWSPRLAQGVDTLIQHALAGFAGPAGDEMPARGGNDDLTDEEVSAAVRYLVSHVQ